MNQSDKLDLLASALAKAQASLSAAKKDRVNPHFKNQYATLQSIWESAREVLAPNGLSIVQTFDATDGRLMSIRTTLMHNSGQWIAGVLSMAPQQANPQGIGSAITYGRRYSLAAILGIVADEDDDGNDASREPHDSHDQEREAYRSAPPVRPQTPAPARAAAPAKTTPGATSGDWRNAVIHFGKQKGAKLGEISEDSLRWWMFEWSPRPYQGKIDADASSLRAALDDAKAYLTRTQDTTGADSDVPF